MVQSGYKAGPEQFPSVELAEYAVTAEKAGFDILDSSDHFHPWSEEGQASIASSSIPPTPTRMPSWRIMDARCCSTCVNGGVKHIATQHADEYMRAVLAQQPLGLVFDIDGTLSPIAPTPAEARLYPGVAPLLERARQYAHIGIMTGRAIEAGANMVNVEGLTYIGTHGIEWSEGLPSSHPVSVVPEAAAFIEPGSSLLAIAEEKLANLPGILIERKRVGGSIHYRLSPNPEETRLRILALLEEPAQRSHMRLIDGKRVVDVQAPLAADKGKALKLFAERFAVRGIVFAGDDRTDLDAMQAAEQLRQTGITTLTIAVKHEDSLPALLKQANIVVQDVQGMATFLAQIVNMLEKQR